MAGEELFHLGIKAIIRMRRNPKDISGNIRKTDVKEGKILLLRVNPEKLGGGGKAYWDIPGGRIKRGSNILDTLRREIFEETGIKIKNAEFLSACLSNIRIPVESGDVGLILFCYICEVEGVANVKLSDEHLRFKWASSLEASKLLEHKYPREFCERIKSLNLENG